MNICGIYSITCAANGKQYVGSSRNVKSRWRQHRCDLRRGEHANGHLQRAWNKYGEDGFAFGLIEDAPIGALIEREMFWIGALNPAYNQRQPDPAKEGWVVGQDTRKKISVALTGIKRPSPTDAQRKNLSALRMGHAVSPETCQKISDAKKGRSNGRAGYKHSEDTLRKMSDSQKGHGNRRPGYKHSQDTRLKISEANKGQHPSEATLQKLSEAHKGRTLSDETRKKLSEALKGRKKLPLSLETRLKISQSKLGSVPWNKGHRKGDDGERLDQSDAVPVFSD